MATITTVYDRKRGCGWRKPGGMYLRADGEAMACGKMPIPLAICPCCGGGVKPTRGWTWINGSTLADGIECSSIPAQCAVCPLSRPMGRVGLLWIGEAFYKTPDAFTRECAEQGISRRISAIPRDFKLGETWIWFAHRKLIKNPDDTWTPGVFRIFRPTRIEYVVKGDETEQELDRLEARGLTLVRVERVGEHPLFSEETNASET